MTDHYEMPHPDADACAHAGVGKACRPCREVLDNLHRISLRDTPAGKQLLAEGWEAACRKVIRMAWADSSDAEYLADEGNPYRKDKEDHQ